MTDLISRADAIDAVEGLTKYMEKLVEGAEKFPEAHTKNYKHDMEQQIVGVAHASQVILELPSADAVHGWIPCSERLPSDDEIVNITWVNHNPPPYYADMAEKPFVASGLRYRDKWYWYSSVCQDLHQDFDLIDKDIEVIAWQPLPKPYKGGDDE